MFLPFLDLIVNLFHLVSVAVAEHAFTVRAILFQAKTYTGNALNQVYKILKSRIS